MDVKDSEAEQADNLTLVGANVSQVFSALHERQGMPFKTQVKNLLSKFSPRLLDEITQATPAGKSQKAGADGSQENPDYHKIQIER